MIEEYAAFVAPEQIEMLLENFPPLSERTLLSWIGRMGTLEAWKELVPSLKRAMVYGVEIR